MLPEPITDIYPFNRTCAFNVDYQGDEYRICWLGDWRKPPDLSAFPPTDGATASNTPHSPAMEALWKPSRVVIHGLDAHIRELENCPDDFPICKIAITDRQRRLVQDEFDILRLLLTLDLGIAVSQTNPFSLQDAEGIFGFKMEGLTMPSWSDSRRHVVEVKKTIEQLHQAGVVHYDLSPSKRHA